jgi:hypothetical protein
LSRLQNRWKIGIYVLGLTAHAALFARDLKPSTAALQAHEFSTALSLSREALVKDRITRSESLDAGGIALTGLNDYESALTAFRRAESFAPDYVP